MRSFFLVFVLFATVTAQNCASFTSSGCYPCLEAGCDWCDKKSGGTSYCTISNTTNCNASDRNGNKDRLLLGSSPNSKIVCAGCSASYCEECSNKPHCGWCLDSGACITHDSPSVNSTIGKLVNGTCRATAFVTNTCTPTSTPPGTSTPVVSSGKVLLQYHWSSNGCNGRPTAAIASVLDICFRSGSESSKLSFSNNILLAQTFKSPNCVGASHDTTALNVEGKLGSCQDTVIVKVANSFFSDYYPGQTDTVSSIWPSSEKCSGMAQIITVEYGNLCRTKTCAYETLLSPNDIQVTAVCGDQYRPPFSASFHLSTPLLLIGSFVAILAL